MTGTRNLIWLLPLILLISSPLWWSPLAAFLQPRGDFTTPANNNRQRFKAFTMQGVSLIQNKGGKRELVLEALEVSSSPSKENNLEMMEIDAILFDDQNRQISITSGEADYDTKKQILTLLDNVILTSPDGYELKTEVLRFLTKYRKIKTAAAVSLTGKNLDLKGKTMFLDLDSNNFRIGGRVFFNTW